MITVVISTYNHAHYLPIQLASIIRQGASVSRIIVVNDGSTDDTADVLAKIQLNESLPSIGLDIWGNEDTSILYNAVGDRS